MPLAFVCASGLLLAILHRRSQPRAPRANWANSVAFHPAAFHQPSTLQALQALVRAAPRLKVIGSAHSFNTLACSAPQGGALLCLSALQMDGESERSEWKTE